MFSFAGRASTASSIVASLATPAPPSKPSSPAFASARRPRLIMSAPVFAAPSAVAVRAHARMHGSPDTAPSTLCYYALALHACMHVDLHTHCSHVFQAVANKLAHLCAGAKPSWASLVPVH